MRDPQICLRRMVPGEQSASQSTLECLADDVADGAWGSDHSFHAKSFRLLPHVWEGSPGLWSRTQAAMSIACGMGQRLTLHMVNVMRTESSGGMLYPFR